jgi:uncharacterized protein YcfJ
MKNIVVKSVLSTALLAAAGVSFAQANAGNAFGVVISATPVVQQVTVPKQVCTTSTVQYVQPSGGGALIGALVGGAVGNQFGRGDGRAVATVIGALGGGIVGKLPRLRDTACRTVLPHPKHARKPHDRAKCAV